MNELIVDILIYDEKIKKGITIDFVRTGTKIRNGKRIGCYKAIIDKITEKDL